MEHGKKGPGQPDDLDLFQNLLGAEETKDRWQEETGKTKMTT